MTNARQTGNYTSIDTETTGLSCSVAEVIEIGAVRFRNWEPVESLDILIKPHGSLPYFITNLTGITKNMLEGKPYFEEIIDSFMCFIGDDDIVGHNLTFDLNFLSSGGAPMYTSGLEFYDTLKLARRLLKKGVDIDNHQLGTMCEYYGIDTGRSHRAEDDARATGILFKKLISHGA